MLQTVDQRVFEAIRHAVAAGCYRAMARQDGCAGLNRLAERHAAAGTAALADWLEGRGTRQRTASLRMP